MLDLPASVADLPASGNRTISAALLIFSAWDRPSTFLVNVTITGRRAWLMQSGGRRVAARWQSPIGNSSRARPALPRLSQLVSASLLCVVSELWSPKRGTSSAPSAVDGADKLLAGAGLPGRPGWRLRRWGDRGGGPCAGLFPPPRPREVAAEWEVPGAPHGRDLGRAALNQLPTAVPRVWALPPGCRAAAAKRRLRSLSRRPIPRATAALAVSGQRHPEINCYRHRHEEHARMPCTLRLEHRSFLGHVSGAGAGGRAAQPPCRPGLAGVHVASACLLSHSRAPSRGADSG